MLSIVLKSVIALNNLPVHYLAMQILRRCKIGVKSREAKEFKRQAGEMKFFERI